MKNVITMAIGLLCAFGAYAGEGKVHFKDFNDYRDVYPSNEVKGAFHKRLAKQFEKHVAKLAEKLPDGYKLDVTFNDIDLAGEARFNMDNIRVVKDIYFPRLDISYRLVDNKGQQVIEATEELKDMSFLDRIKSGREGSLYYEKRLLDQWFESQIAKAVKS
ncbi:DUF3016 domain-containing protein [Pseudoalteromonas sp. JBTF-M23]|uniref:DUF3016 domain-containing protein n=1 Tax=Pseudoalteromonas caenipelagi TaxID=2726988 RepID=A0A849VN99_9GAMM|nr:DUF3016 domain-containing protein [Pseudoalteromonas caenipelagi]NOU53184.1 DUF3016 domain-containing protein [Pseudoalteromonas caenipelagi]